MDLEIRHLRVVCAIADAGSLTRAAAALRTTQPGLSAQLRRIENLLGGSLFDRRRAGAAPTPLGELVLARARAILPGIDQLLSDTARATHRAAAPVLLRFGSVGAPLLGHLLTAVRELLPGVQMTSRCQYAPAPLLDDVRAGRLEAAIVGDHPGQEPAAHDDVLLYPLVTEPVFALLPADHPMAAQQEVDLARLAEEDWAAPRADSDRTREYWWAAFHRTDRHPRVPYEAEGRQLVELVRAGLAVSLCQATFLEVPGVAVRPLAGNPLWYRHVLAWHRDGPLTEHAEAILRHVGDGYLSACSAGPVYASWRQRFPEAAQLLVGAASDRRGGHRGPS